MATGGEGSATGDLTVDDRLTIPAAELEMSFQTSGGPGGQHANRSATGVALTWAYGDSATLTADEKERLASGLSDRGRGGRVRVVADKSRSQWRNRSLARSRLRDMVARALRTETPRKPTRAGTGARRRRLEQKRRRSETKRLRRKPGSID